MHHPLPERQAQAEDTAARVDLYAGIHKALRAQMADALLAIGRMDSSDDLELADGMQRVLQLMAACRSHLMHENQWVHPVLEARASGSSAAVAREHLAHEQDIERLAGLAAALWQTPPMRRAAGAHALYLQLALFIGHNLAHMHVEETEHNTLLWAHCSDAELAALENALVASIPPQEKMDTLRWMLPAMTPPERLALLSGIQARGPAPAFEAALELLRPQLCASRWQALCQCLGLPGPYKAASGG